jgi:hypothetical protein
VRRADYLHVPIVLKSGSLNLLETSGPVKACNGIALLYTFRALLAHPQEALHKRHLVYCVRMSVAVKLQSCHSQLTLYAHNTPSAVCSGPSEDEQVMFETCRGP